MSVETAESPEILILLVEDNSVESMLIKRTVCQAVVGTRCEAVHSAEMAMAYLAGEGIYADRELYPLPQTIVTDLRLPGRSGLELLAWIQQQEHLRHLPVIVLTGMGNREIERAYDLGAYFYMLKPLAGEVMAEVLATFQDFKPDRTVTQAR